jgi:hypothetical protein
MDATGSDRNFGTWPSAAASEFLDFFDDVHAFNDFAEYDMFLIEP